MDPVITAASEAGQPARSRPAGSAPEAPVRYLLPGGRMGASSVGDYGRTLACSAMWLGAAPVAARLLARLGCSLALRRFGTAWAGGVRRSLRIDLRMEGLRNIDPSERYVVTPLHEGFADAVALLHLPLRLRFVARDELFDWRWLGPLLRDTGQIRICPERGAWSYRSLLRGARAVFEAGESLVVFPQGTILGVETDFHGGAFHLAHSVGRPILPVALTGGHRVWEHPYTPRLRFGQRMSLRVLPPVGANEVRDTPPEALRVRIRDQLKGAALDGTMVAPRHFVPQRDGYWDGYAYRIDPGFSELAEDVARHRAGASRPGAGSGG